MWKFTDLGTILVAHNPILPDKKFKIPFASVGRVGKKIDIIISKLLFMENLVLIGTLIKFMLKLLENRHKIKDNVPLRVKIVRFTKPYFSFLKR